MFFDRSLVAIDIGSSSVKIVEMTGNGDRKLRAIGLELLKEGMVIDGVITEIDGVTSTVKKLIKKLKISTAGRRAAIALSGSSLLIKRVGFEPKNTPEEMHEQIYYEAEQHFQHDIDELYFDYHQISDTPDQEGTLPVVMVGAKREVVEQYLTLVRSLGMRTGVIDCDVFAVTNMFEYNYGVDEGLIALINIGATATQVSLIYQGDHLYTRDITLAGNEYSERLTAALSIDKDNAENLKVAASQGDDSIPDAMHNVLNEVNQSLVSEIKMTIDYFFQSDEIPPGISNLNQIFLAGGGSRTLGLDAAVAAAMQLPVQVVNPFHRVEVNPKRFQLDYILAQGHLYGVAAGLAMRHINDSNAS